MNVHGDSARTGTAPWPRCGPTSAPGSRGLRRGRCRSRGALPGALAPRLPDRVPGRARRRRGRGHRAGGHAVRDPDARPVRSAPSVRAVAPPDRRQPGHRLGRARALRAEAASPRWSSRTERTRRPYTQPVLAALGELSPEHRAVIVLRHLLEYSPREIARMLDLPRGTVNSGSAGAWTSWRTSSRSTRTRCDRGPASPRAARIQPPDELGATRRSWQLARAAFDEREPTPWPRRHARWLVAAAVAIAALVALVSPPGRAVISDVRRRSERRTSPRCRRRDAALSLPARVACSSRRRAASGSWRRTAPTAARRLRRGVVVARRTGRRLGPEPARRLQPDGRGPVDTRPAPRPRRALVAERVADRLPERVEPPCGRGRQDRRPASRRRRRRRSRLAAGRAARRGVRERRRRADGAGHRHG